MRKGLKIRKYHSLCAPRIFQLIKFNYGWHVPQERRTAGDFTESSSELELARPSVSSSSWWVLPSLLLTPEPNPGPWVRACSCTHLLSSGVSLPPLLFSAKVNSKKDHKLMVHVLQTPIYQLVIQGKWLDLLQKHLLRNHSRCCFWCHPRSGLPRVRSESALSCCPRQTQPVGAKDMTMTMAITVIIL